MSDSTTRATAATVAVPNGDGTETVIWCSRPGHPGPYAHTHPYISALCADGEHVTCTLIGVEMGTPDFCDCECGHVH